MKEEMFPHPGKPLHWCRDQLGQKGSCRDLEEGAAAGLQQTKQRPAQRICATLCSSQPKMHACWYVQGLGAETWASEDRPGERTGVGCTETA